MRANIPEELQPIFDRVRKHVKAKPGRSRTEAFLEWIEAHPEEVWAMRSEQAEKDLRRMLAEEHRRSVRLRKTAAAVRELEAVPF